MKKNSILPVFIFSGLIIGIVLKMFVIDFLHISGSSMSPALRNTDTVVVNKLKYGLVVPFKGKFFVQWAEPKKNDVVIFFHDNKIVVKRVKAVSGDSIDFSTDKGYILNVNGQEIPLTIEQYASLKDFQTVPQGFVMVLGDNLAESLDSRDYGFVSVKNITGKIIGK